MPVGASHGFSAGPRRRGARVPAGIDSPIMCRLFAQRADPDFDYCEPLCGAASALRFQSYRHPHGWGIGWYVGREPRVRRGLLPAHADRAFVEAARAARSRLVLVHVRDASVGRVAAENTHPFAAGPWLFAHNGTVARFKTSASLRAAIERRVHPRLRRRIRGETDSERCFYLFLTRLGEHSRSRAPDLDSRSTPRRRPAAATSSRWPASRWAAPAGWRCPRAASRAWTPRAGWPWGRSGRGVTPDRRPPCPVGSAPRSAARPPSPSAGRGRAPRP